VPRQDSNKPRRMRRESIPSTGASLPPGFLVSAPISSTVKEAFLPLVQCRCPPSRPDLEVEFPITSQEVETFCDVAFEEMIANPPPGGVSVHQAASIAMYTMDTKIYRVLNAWGNEANRTAAQMAPVALAYRMLVEALHSLPASYKYRGRGVRILSLADPPSSTSSSSESAGR
jgi:hypothetical protein